jgi:hypothetical protein
MMKNKVGRPRKADNEIKISTSVRLSKDQVDVLLFYGNSKQRGIDYLIKWAKENWGLIENNKIKDQ